MRYKIVRFQNLMWRNMMRSTKSKKVSVLHYSIDIDYPNSEGNTLSFYIINLLSWTLEIFVRRIMSLGILIIVTFSHFYPNNSLPLELPSSISKLLQILFYFKLCLILFMV